MLKTLNTKKAPQPIGPYSQGVDANGLVFLSGQIGLKPHSGDLVASLAEQTKQIMENIGSVLESAGCSMANVVKSTVYLRNMNDFAEFNKIYATYFKNNPPARTTVEVSALPKNALIEIDIIARK